MSAVKKYASFLFKPLMLRRAGIALLLAIAVLTTTIAHACASQLQAAANPITHAVSSHHHSMPARDTKRDNCAFGCDQLGPWAAPATGWHAVTAISQAAVSLGADVESLIPRTILSHAVICIQRLFLLKQPLFIINLVVRI